MRSTLSIILIIISCCFFHIGCKDKDSSSSQPCIGEWEEHSGNPIIDYEYILDDIIWNDPCVIKEGSIYKMWLSGGKGYGINYVKIYAAVSDDGIAWDLDPTVILEPNSDITVTYDRTTPSGVAGSYKLVNETDVKPSF